MVKCAIECTTLTDPTEYIAKGFNDTSAKAVYVEDKNPQKAIVIAAILSTQ